MELTTDTDRELIEAARAAIDANTDTSGPTRTACTRWAPPSATARAASTSG